MVNFRRDALSWKGLRKGLAAWQLSGLPTWMSMRCFKQSCNSSLQHTWSASGDNDFYDGRGERCPFAESWKKLCHAAILYAVCCLKQNQKRYFCGLMSACVGSHACC